MKINSYSKGVLNLVYTNTGKTSTKPAFHSREPLLKAMLVASIRT